jgi:hypothetical protein
MQMLMLYLDYPYKAKLEERRVRQSMFLVLM